MPHLTVAAVSELRRKYQAAHAAHQSRARAVSEAALSGTEISPLLLEQEARALCELEKIRADLLAAMAEEGGAATAGEPPP